MRRPCAFPRIRLQTSGKKLRIVCRTGCALSEVSSSPAYEGAKYSEFRHPNQWNAVAEYNLLTSGNRVIKRNSSTTVIVGAAECLLKDNFRVAGDSGATAIWGSGIKLFPMAPAAPSTALYHRLLRLSLRLTMFLAVLIALLCCGLRIYTAYLVHRAIVLLDETARIPVGTTEDSILPLVSRYGGQKQIPSPPEDIEDCPNKADCEYHNAHIPDYSYEVNLSTLNVYSGPDRQPERLRRAVAFLMTRTPSFLRDLLSMRFWLADVSIWIRAGRVEAIHGGVYVEGRPAWLGNAWSLSADMPTEWRSKNYVVDGTFLEMWNDGGAGTIHHLTPAATPEQFQAARDFNSRCLTGLIPCRCLGDLNPSAFQYMSKHPEVGDTITTPGCPSPH